MLHYLRYDTPKATYKTSTTIIHKHLQYTTIFLFISDVLKLCAGVFQQQADGLGQLWEILLA